VVSQGLQAQLRVRPEPWQLEAQSAASLGQPRVRVPVASPQVWEPESESVAEALQSELEQVVQRVPEPASRSS
jgi:hypothetical protein